MNIIHHLFKGSSIHIKGVGILNQPTVEHLMACQIDLEEILTPFTVSIDALDLTDEEKTQIKDFDLLFFQHFQREQGQKSLLEELVNSLVVLMGTNNIAIDYENLCLTINGAGKVNRDNFNELSEIAFKIFYREKPKPTKPKTQLSPKQQAIIDKLNKLRREHQKKNETKLEDIVNVVIHGGSSFISYAEVLSFTYWQLINSYNSIITIDNYKEFLRYKSSGQFEIKEEVDHWIKQLKIK